MHTTHRLILAGLTPWRRPVSVHGNGYRALMRSTLVKLIFGAALPVAILAAGTLHLPEVRVDTAPAPYVTHTAPATAHVDHTYDPAAPLLRAHGCWTQSGPVGVIPGHAVVNVGGHVRYVGGAAASRALERAAAGHTHGVYGFCR